MERYVKVGVTAMRGADGKFLPAVDLYTKVDESEILPGTDMTKTTAAACDEIAMMFAEKMKQYIDGCEAAGVGLVGI